MPPSDGIPLQNCSYWSRKCPRVPRERSPSLGHVSDVLRVIPRSACSGAAVEPFEGPTYEPLISSGSEPERSEAAVEPFRGASLRTYDQ
jgi:alpha-D-ribose 1-methylphosphonate 5-triphosphate synthase subunit PhnL